MRNGPSTTNMTRARHGATHQAICTCIAQHMPPSRPAPRPLASGHHVAGSFLTHARGVIDHMQARSWGRYRLGALKYKTLVNIDQDATRRASLVRPRDAPINTGGELCPSTSRRRASAARGPPLTPDEPTQDLHDLLLALFERRSPGRTVGRKRTGAGWWVGAVMRKRGRARRAVMSCASDSGFQHAAQGNQQRGKAGGRLGPRSRGP